MPTISAPIARMWPSTPLRPTLDQRPDVFEFSATRGRAADTGVNGTTSGDETSGNGPIADVLQVHV